VKRPKMKRMSVKRIPGCGCQQSVGLQLLYVLQTILVLPGCSMSYAVAVGTISLLGDAIMSAATEGTVAVAAFAPAEG
jgi:hypothetical protein